MQDVQQKLAAVEAALRRWHSRLTRAANEVRRLEMKRRRLLLAPPKPPSFRPGGVTYVSEAADIPAFLDRSNPLIAEAMTAARKKAEEADRHKMPLTGRAALEAVKPVSAKRKAKAKA